MKLSTRIAGVLLLLSLAHRSFSQQPQELDIDKITKGVPLIPISLSGFTGEVQSVLTFDLEVAGFKIVPADGAQYSVTGSNAGDVQGQLTDRVTKAVLLSNRYPGGTPRSQAHTLADDIVLKITGKPGISRTRIAFKREGSARSEIYVADYDGANAQALTSDGVIVAAPCWAPGKRMLYYTSYRSGWPDIYSHDLSSGERRIIAKYPGLNTSAAVSPDGRRVAMILSKDGNPELYLCSADGGNLKRLTTTIQEDESSPCWSPDGRTICYVSRKGLPGLYLISADGGTARRLSTAGASRVTEPDWSPDGKWIAFTVQRGNSFEICVIPAQGGEVATLVPGEDPSWAPNSRTIVFTRSIRSKNVLSLLDVPTKRVKDVAQSLGGCSQPSWAK